MTQIYKTINKIPRRVGLSVVLVAIILMFYFGFLNMLIAFPTLSMLPYWVTVALVGVTLFRAVDDFVLTEIHTYNLLKRNPIGYAIYLLGYAIIIAACLSNA